MRLSTLRSLFLLENTKSRKFSLKPVYFIPNFTFIFIVDEKNLMKVWFLKWSVKKKVNGYIERICLYYLK